MFRKTAYAYAVPKRPTFEGDPNPTVNLEDPAVKAAIEAAVATATEPLVVKRDEILGEKKALAKTVLELEKKWKDLDPEMVRNLLSQVEGNEEAKLLAEGKVDEVLERRTEKMRAQALKDVEAANKRADDLEATLGKSNARVKRLVVDHAVAAAARDVEGFVASAVPDAIRRAHDVFTIQDDSEIPVALDGDGTVVRGKDTKTPLGVGEWLAELVGKECKHWLEPSSGGGARGSGDGTPGSVDADALEKMSPREKLAVGLRKQHEESSAA